MGGNRRNRKWMSGWLRCDATLASTHLQITKKPHYSLDRRRKWMRDSSLVVLDVATWSAGSLGRALRASPKSNAGTVFPFRRELR